MTSYYSSDVIRSAISAAVRGLNVLVLASCREGWRTSRYRSGRDRQGNPDGALRETVPDPHERRDGRACDEADQRLCREERDSDQLGRGRLGELRGAMSWARMSIGG